MWAADRPGQKERCAERGEFSLAPSIRPVELVASQEVRSLTTWPDGGSASRLSRFGQARRLSYGGSF